MKHCPTCNRTYSEQNLSFCIEDGTPLVTLPSDETTVVSPSSESSGSQVPPTPSSPSDWKAPAYQPPGSNLPPGQQRKRKVWPWVVGILAVLVTGVVGLGIAAALIIPKMMRATANGNSSNLNANVEQSDGDKANLNSNTRNLNSDSGNTNDNLSNDSDDEQTAPPTDRDKVLADLTDLEHQWMVANINADKKKLDQVLADDYVSTISDGKKQGKAEYLRTIERDTAIQKWDFEDLKLDLKGERATLSGAVRFQLRDQEVADHFTDKFIWRDDRWQATSSELTPIK